MKAAGMQTLPGRNYRQPCLPSCSYSIVSNSIAAHPRLQIRPVLVRSPALRRSRRLVAAYDNNWSRTEREMQQKYRDISSQYEAKARQLAEQYEARARELRSQQEERRREMQQRQQSMVDALNARREGIDWRALVLPALGLAWVTFFLGPLIFGLLAAGLAIGMAVTFSAASMFLLLPLFGGALLLGGIGFGLSAGAFLLPGLVFSFFNLLVVGGGLAAGAALTNSLLRGGRAAPRPAKAASKPGKAVTVEVEVRDTEAREEEELSRAAAEELRRFDALLAERERERQVEQGTRWKP